MGTATRLLRNTGFSIFGSVVGRLSSYVFFIVISRHYGVSMAGAFSIALSYFYLGSRVSFWGLDHLLTREVARQPSALSHYLVNFITLRALFGFFAICVIYALVRVSGLDEVTTVTIMIVATSVLFENVSNICQASFVASEQLEVIALVSTVSGISKILLAIQLREAGIWAIAVAFSGSNLLSMLLTFALVFPRLKVSVSQLDLDFSLKQLKIALPFFFVSTFFILDNQVDVILLSMLANEHDVGLYSAALTVVTALLMVPQGFRTAVFPLLARYQVASLDALRRIYQRSTRYMLLIALPSAVGVTMLAGKAISLVYGPSFAGSVGLLQVAIWSYFAYCLTVLSTRVLIVHDRQGGLARLLMASAIVSVVLNLSLVPLIGVMGAAVAKVISSILLFVLAYRATTRIVGAVGLWDALWRSSVASGLMAAAIWLAGPAGLVAQIVAGIVAYGFGLLAVGGLCSADLQPWTSAVKRQMARLR